MAFVLYTRRGCPLCEEAEDIVAALVPGQATLVDVDSDPGLVRRFGDRVPVLAVVDALPGAISPGAVVPEAVGPEAVWMEGRFDEPLLVRLLTSGGPASSLQSPSVRARASDPGDRAGR